MKNEKSKSIFNSNDDADIYIQLCNNSKKNNNTSEATAIATNRLIRIYDNKLVNMTKPELVKLIKNET